MEEQINEIITNNKDNIDLLNNFSKEFFNTNNIITEKITAISSKIDTLLEEEKKKDNVLAILESKITAIELGNTLKHLVEQRVMLNDKYSELNKKIEMISNTIRENKQIVDSVYKVIGVLDENINTINTSISSRQV